MTLPLDHAERELAVDPSRSVIVKAPAGSGKTTLLVTRYLTLLGRAEKPEDILAITFTIKSAAEMRARVLSALRNGQPNAAAALARNETMGWNLLAHPVRLKIQTIDSFAMSVIRQLPLASGLYPYAHLREHAESLYRSATHRVLYKLYLDDALAPYIAEFLAVFDNDYSRAQSLLVNMLQRRDQWLDAVRELVSVHQESPDELQAILRQGVESLAGRAISELMNVLSQRQIEAIEEIVAGVAVCLNREIDDPADKWRLLGETLTTRQGSFRRQLTSREGFARQNAAAKEQTRSLIEELRELGCEPLVENLRHLPEASVPSDQLRELTTVCVVLALAVLELNDEFRREGVADFNQLLLSARTALRDVDGPTELALALDYRIRHILVDEFQDTSVAQFHLFADLLQGWSEADGNTFFAVGDPMQSIYRFRDAEVSLFYDAWHQGIAGLPLEQVRLSSNFRACPPLVSWHNSVFSEVMGSGEDPLLGRVPYEPATAARTGSQRGAVQVGLLRDEAGQVAAVVDHIGTLTEAEPDSSIALLVRSRSHLREILPALRRAKLGWRARDIDPLVEKPIVQDLLSLLRALDDPYDRVAWLSVLRAPWIGLNLADLEQFAGTDDIPSALAADLTQLSEDGAGRASRLNGALLEGFSLVDQVPPRTVLETIWIRCGGTDAYTDPNALDHAERLLELIDSLGHDGLNSDAVSDAASHLYANDSSEAQLEILTIHKAKGLEFDHVVVPALERIPARSSAPLLRWRPEGRGLLIGAKDTPGSYPWLAREDVAREAHELERLLYVACTRARESLHLFATVEDRPAAGSLLALLWPQLKQEPVGPGLCVPVQTGFFQSSGYERLPGNYTWLPPRQVERLGTNSKGEAGLTPDVVGTKTEVALGTLLHRAFVVLAASGPDTNIRAFLADRQALWRQDLRAARVHEFEHDRLLGEIGRQIQNLVGDEQGRWLLSQQTDAHSELGLSGIVAGELTNVILDRTFEVDGVRWVIDYKTANIDEGQSVDAFVASQVQRYRPQMETYGHLASMTFDSPVTIALYFSALPRLEVLR